jgi:head-tail adaptor
MKQVNLTRKLELEAASEVPDGMGGFTLGWLRLGTLWAEVKPGTGRERAGEEVVLAAVSYRITLRASKVGAVSRPKPGQRFRDGQRLFSILAVTERDDDARLLICFAKEETSA